MKVPLIRVPRHDADHLAILLLVGGVVALRGMPSTAASVWYIWLTLGVVSIITAILLWARVRHAKWGGVLVGVLLAVSPIVRSREQGSLGHGLLLALGAILIVAWFLRLDEQPDAQERIGGDAGNADDSAA